MQKKNYENCDYSRIRFGKNGKGLFYCHTKRVPKGFVCWKFFPIVCESRFRFYQQVHMNHTCGVERCENCDHSYKGSGKWENATVCALDYYEQRIIPAWYVCSYFECKRQLYDEYIEFDNDSEIEFDMF